MPRRPDMPPLRREELAPDPVAQFGAWWELALKEAVLAEAMTLATVDSEGAPDARMVLLKGFDERGFRFHTNYQSEKGRQLEVAGRAALVIYWRELDRQVRVRGSVERLSAEESDEYWRTRPRESQLGAWASPQSERDRVEGGARRSRRHDGEVRGRGGAAAGALGRLPAATRRGRVLAGPGRPPPRPLPLLARRRRLARSSGWRPSRACARTRAPLRRLRSEARP